MILSSIKSKSEIRLKGDVRGGRRFDLAQYPFENAPPYAYTHYKRATGTNQEIYRL